MRHLEVCFMKTIFTIVLVFGACAMPSFAAGNDAGSWDRNGAAAYLDQRATWWATWKPAARDHDTFCISCHTTLPYALGRPALHAALGEHGPSANEQKVIENVTKRVQLWSEVEPVYNDAKSGANKSAESRGTEAVLYALVLSSYDARDGKFSSNTRQALDNMWALQLKTGDQSGAITWLNFHNEPWEADDSQYWGATLAAVAAGNSPEKYRATPEVRQGIEALRGYLVRQQASQSLLNRVGLLWASTKLPDLLTKEQQDAIVHDLWARQREDGGWSASSLVPPTWKRKDSTPLESKSDGYATGLVAFVFRQAGIARSEARMEKALAWLERNQDKASGMWPAYSLNKQRDPATDAAKFMSDAATAYSVLALEK
jgi:squalene-hopene/tetraprenyl-beta-curcumene cyclase